MMPDHISSYTSHHVYCYSTFITLHCHSCVFNIYFFVVHYPKFNPTASRGVQLQKVICSNAAGKPVKKLLPENYMGRKNNLLIIIAYSWLESFILLFLYLSLFYVTQNSILHTVYNLHTYDRVCIHKRARLGKLRDL
jgi:hypothetical protein